MLQVSKKETLQIVLLLTMDDCWHAHVTAIHHELDGLSPLGDNRQEPFLGGESLSDVIVYVFTF